MMATAPGRSDATRQQRRQAALVDAVERREVVRLLAALEQQAIRALILKGFALRHTIYGDACARPHGDVDLLVKASAFDRTIATAESLGFAPSIETTDPAVKGQRELTKHGAVPVVIDVHTRLCNPRLFDAVDAFDALFIRSQPVSSLGPFAFSLGTVDALLHALVHRVAHHYGSNDPQWLMDVHLLAAQLDAAAWSELSERARGWRVSAIALDGLRAAAQMYATDITPTNTWPSIDEPSAALLRRPASELRLQWLSLRSLEGWSEKSTFVRAHAFPAAGYMLRRYATTQRWRLPELYVRRLVRSAVRWAARRTSS